MPRQTRRQSLSDLPRGGHREQDTIRIDRYVERIGANARLIEYFLVVAEELHFGRAAGRLHVSQPAVSRAVQQLEALLGVALFVRAGRTVYLTDAGKDLRANAPEGLESLSRALESARAAGTGQLDHLSLTFLPSARNLVLPAVQRFRERFSTVRLAVHEALDQQQFSDLAAGRSDLGVVRGHREDPDLVFINLVDAELCAAVPTPHPCAGASAITYADLAADPFVLWPRDDSPDGYDLVIGACRRAGFSPRIVAETSEAQTVLSLVAAGVGVSILGSSLRETAPEGVNFVPLLNEHDTLYLVWRAHDASEARREFSEILVHA
jgi:DNA-binding transcriptional LysR family regulator